MMDEIKENGAVVGYFAKFRPRLMPTQHRPNTSYAMPNRITTLNRYRNKP